MRPERTRGGLAPYFFLAYARTPEHPWVRRFFCDLSQEIVERTTWPVNTPVGFMDDSGIPLGREWRPELNGALAACRVFVPLYSRRYFTREECGKEWHAFAQRILDHGARNPEAPPAIVPVVWTPVDTREIPKAARQIQMNHAHLGEEYAREGIYTLIKNALFHQQYVTAVQRLARHIIHTAESSRLPPCDVRDLGQLRNAFGPDPHPAPADQRLHIVIAAPTVNRLPPDRRAAFYGRSAHDWNPFYPASRQTIGEYAAAVARLHSYEPNVLPFDEGVTILANTAPVAGLGLLLVDAWAAVDEGLSRQLRELDSQISSWVRMMVLWNTDDQQTTKHALELQDRLRNALPHRLDERGPCPPGAATRILSLEQFRTHFPQVVGTGLNRYLNHAAAYPPTGAVPPRPRLSGPRER